MAGQLGLARATLHRRKASGRLTTDESDKVVRFARLLGHAVHLFGSVEEARRWLKAPQRDSAEQFPSIMPKLRPALARWRIFSAGLITAFLLMPSGWRIDKPRRNAFSGEGARRFGGRWNSPGVAVVYLSEHQSLAALEIFVHMQPLVPHDKYLAYFVEWDEAQMEVLSAKKLPPDWRTSPPGPSTMQLGRSVGGRSALRPSSPSRAR